MKVKNGELIYYRAFDIGDEIFLTKASKILEQSTSHSRFKLRKFSRGIVVKDAPLTVNLGNWEQEYFGKNYSIKGVARLWNFGAISVAFHIKLFPSTSFEDLTSLATFLDNDEETHKRALNKVEQLSSQIKDAIDNPHLWDQFEDYLIFRVKEFDKQVTPSEILDFSGLYNLLMGDNEEVLSQQTIDSLKTTYYTYSNDDLAVIDWNSAIIYEPTDLEDISDLLEFGICQLLELRYYDDLLDQKLQNLYTSIEKQGSSIWSNKYQKLGETAAVKYMEISEIVENVENSIKVVGDLYYAKIFNAINIKFRVKDWQQSVDNKLSNLAEVSRLFNDGVNEKRLFLLELIIVVLIAFEVIPYLFEFSLKFFPHWFK